MSYAITINDQASAAIQKLLAKTSPRAIGEIVWPPALELTQRHLTNYKNQKGFPSQGFGEQLADKTYGASTDDGAKIVIHGQGARQLIEGGIIRPATKTMLCFGITAESYGHTLPEMFGGAIPPRKQRSESDKAKLKALRKEFAFAPEVHQSPHPEVLPGADEYNRVIKKSISDAIAGGFN